MGNLVKEFYNIQNPALSAYLLSRFSLGYMEENQDMAPMPLLFIVLPMMYKKEIVDFIASTQKKSGLRFFADKFTEKKNSNKDLILQIQNTSQRYKVMTLEAIGIGMSGKLFEIQKDAYRKTLTIQIDRLSISKWLNELISQNEICPFCGSKHNVDGQMRELIGNLENLEEESEEIAEIPVAFEREYSIVQGKISELTERLGAVQKSIKIQNNKKDETYNQKYTLESVSRFLGKLQYAEETYRAIGYDGELQEEISELQKKIIVLQNEINEGGIRKRFASALENIELKIMKLLPLLDTERPEDSVKIDYKNLTITVTSKSGRKDYLWEIGSGSNWLSYHISVSLAFQMFFAEKKYSPIPQFIVYDQPSQVYFPNKAAQKEEDKDVDPHLEDEDILAVKKIFEAMSEAMEKTKHRMQIIVLEHADESAWEGVSNMHLVEEWRGENNKLIPNEWLD